MARLLDQFGNPIDLKRLKTEEAGPTVTGVRQVVSGHPADGLTPGRLGRLLREAEDGDPTAYLELAEQMEEKDLHYRSVLATRKNQVAGLEITVEAASDDAVDVKAADLVREALFRDTLQEELFDVLDAIGKGFSVTEIIWDTGGGPWMPARLEWRDPRWFSFDRTDGRTVMLRGETGALEPLKPYGYIVHTHKSKSGLPIRGGLARPVAWMYLFKNFDIRSWVQFAESYGRPLRIGKYGAGATDKDKAVLLQAVRNIMGDAAAIIPESMIVEVIEAKITGNVDLFERLASWIDRQVSKVVLGQTGTTDVGQHVGTANAHEQVREDIEGADGGQLAATLTRDYGRPVVDLNMGPQRRYPRIRVFRPDQEDLAELRGALKDLVPLGLKVERAWVADKWGIPDPDKGAEVLTAPTASSGPTPDEATSAHAARTPTRPRDAVDDLVDQLDAAAAPAMDAMIDQVRTVIDQAETIPDAIARLEALYPDLRLDDLADIIGEAMALADLEGRAEVGDV